MKVSNFDTLKYGFVGFILSFAALPLYIATPSIYQLQSGLSLTTIGLILMLVRLIDAFTDPFFGRFIDKTKGHKFLFWLKPSIVILAFSLYFLLNPPAFLNTKFSAIVWMITFTLLVSITNGIGLLSFQSWVISWTNNAGQQNKLISSREMFSLFGVILASLLITLNLNHFMSIVILIISFIAIIFLKSLSNQNLYQNSSKLGKFSWFSVLNKKTSKFFIIFALNALANSIPAILFLFFYRDVLLIDDTLGGILLISYFICAAISIPFWKNLIKKIDEFNTWCVGVLISIIFFIFAFFLNENNFYGFLIICIFTGFALGAELICPPAILSTLIKEQNHNGFFDATYFGIWNLTSKLSLAIASGTVLPLLGLVGYSSINNSSTESLWWLQFFYAAIPCFIKFLCLITMFLITKKLIK